LPGFAVGERDQPRRQVECLLLRDCPLGRVLQDQTIIDRRDQKSIERVVGIAHHHFPLEEKKRLPDQCVQSLATTSPAIDLVVAVMAALTQRGQIQQARRLGPVVVDVRDREHDPRTRNRVRLVIDSAAPLAAIPSSL
jgi:hypothetical protein